MSSFGATSTSDAAAGPPPGRSDGADDLLAGLDPQQRAAVGAPPGSVVVLAAAGSGKTTVLTRRIAWRIAETDAAPEHCLAITFTRQAAGELRRRLRATGAVHRDTGRSVTTGTFHAIGWSLLRQRCLDTGKRVPVVAANRGALVSAVLERTETASVGAVLAVIDWAHARCVSPGDLAEALSGRPGRLPLPPARLARVMADYEALKVRRGVVDLNDMLGRVVDAATEDSVFRESIRWQHRHVHVDEAQDMNPLQHRFLSLVVSDAPDAFVVGDPNQAIYTWNGADPGLFDRLPETIPGTTVLSLGSNYRCTPQIVGAAVHLLGVGGQRADVESRRPDGEAVRWVRCADEHAEIRAVVDAVDDAHRRGVPWAATAVLARTNSLASTMAEALARAGVPVQSRVATRGFLDAVAEASSLSGRHNLRAWSSDVLDRTTPSSDVLDRTTPSSDVPDDDAPLDEGTVAVARHLRDFLAAHPVGAVDGRMFAAWVRTQQSHDEAPGVEVMSIHSAKGREWTAVVVAGAEKGLLPLAGTSGESAREEARLAYVALTRASDRLTVTWTDSRAGRRTGPSPLMRGLDTSPPSSVAPGPDARRIIDAHRRGVSPSADEAAEARARAALAAWRDRQARAARIAPAGVLTDAELDALASLRPRTAEAVTEVLGPVLGNRHSARIVEVLDDLGT